MRNNIREKDTLVYRFTWPMWRRIMPPPPPIEGTHRRLERLARIQVHFIIIASSYVFSTKLEKKMLIAKSLCWENSNIQTSELRYSLGRELSLPPPRRSWDSTLRHKLFSNQNCPFCQDLGGVIRTIKLLSTTDHSLLPVFAKLRWTQKSTLTLRHGRQRIPTHL